MICDFCSSSDIRWIYPADSFEIHVVHELTKGFFEGRSEADWLACDGCSKLIEDNEWKALTERSVKKFGMEGLPQEIIDATRRFLTILHREFRIHRKGNRQLLLLARVETNGRNATTK